ncbi:MAG TPA: (2Fe-2S)-binding protein [Candidatus Omnitrophota bacterium]|nr:(2Fe-2S)-binding protein [Candidatus Omnitrophota bacterium]HPD85216.1 (2Fe-2S)-binding protein [Candidatus Omnitrophota bacterium]HRZ04283.1 (2Fe-2S)-binding protein [Candidatus Omnitrophota bacterium]
MILNINKKQYTVDIQGHETLAEVLRDTCGLTGTKMSCNEAECGACTVIINKKAVLSCITLAADVEGEEITTIEGLSDGDNLHPVQQAFLDHGAVQCGFCSPGMILASKALLDQNPKPDQNDIAYALDGNICRCGGYLKIFDAVRAAAEEKSSVKDKKV